MEHPVFTDRRRAISQAMDILFNSQQQVSFSFSPSGSVASLFKAMSVQSQQLSTRFFLQWRLSHLDPQSLFQVEFVVVHIRIFASPALSLEEKRNNSSFATLKPLFLPLWKERKPLTSQKRETKAPPAYVAWSVFALRNCSDMSRTLAVSIPNLFKWDFFGGGCETLLSLALVNMCLLMSTRQENKHMSFCTLRSRVNDCFSILERVFQFRKKAQFHYVPILD